MYIRDSVRLMPGGHACVQGYWLVRSIISASFGEDKERPSRRAEGKIISCEAMGVGQGKLLWVIDIACGPSGLSSQFMGGALGQSKDLPGIRSL